MYLGIGINHRLLPTYHQYVQCRRRLRIAKPKRVREVIFLDLMTVLFHILHCKICMKRLKRENWHLNKTTASQNLHRCFTT